MAFNPRDNGSEITSFSEEESTSPADGYFVNRQHPQAFFVQSPTAASAAFDTKPQAVSNAHPPSSGASSEARTRNFYSHAPSASFSLNSYHAGETSPLLSNFEGPPPSYTDAMGRKFEYSAVEQEEGLLSLDERRDPVSIGRPQDLEDEILQALPHLKKRRSGLRHWWTTKRCLLIWIAVLSTVALIIGIILATSRKSSPRVVAPPSLPSEPQKEVKDPFQEGLAPWPVHCGNRSISKNEVWTFDGPSEFQFIEAMESDNQIVYGITGETHVAQAPSDQSSNIRVEYYVASSEPETIQNVQYSLSPNGVEITGASFDAPLAGATACMVMAALIYVKPGVSLETLQIDSQNTKVTLHSGLNLNVKDVTGITLTKGGLKASAGSLESRKTIIDIGSGGVTGTYSLYDLLSIKTQSGAISINVEPKEADSASPKPADFRVHSSSGSVNVKYSSFAPPERDYKVSIEANMGSVTATLIHGSETYINAYSGSITSTIIPYQASNTSSVFTTNTISGSTRLTLTSPYKNPGVPIEALKSEHRGKSGSIRLNYPQEWTGQLHGGTQSGRLTLKGKDVRIIREGGGAAGKRVLASKGDGKSDMLFDTMSGSCTIQVGQV